MTYWIFKVSHKSIYPDVPGSEYVYDNTHSIRVKRGDEFLYLVKTSRTYTFQGAGVVARVTSRKSRANEQHSPRVERVFTAHLLDVVWFTEPFDVSRSKKGQANRHRLALPKDLNTIGWSLSMPRLDAKLFCRLVDAALAPDSYETPLLNKSAWRIEDSFSLVQTRQRLNSFHQAVLKRHDHTCVVCGTQFRPALEVAHIRSESSPFLVETLHGS